MTAASGQDHAIPLVRGEWSCWQDAQLRTAGFSVDGLALLSAPDCASAADELIAGRGGRDAYDQSFAEALGRNAAQIRHLASLPKLREAVTWQSRSALIALDRIVDAPQAAQRTARHRRRERMIARYWQRYCGKAETVGFFGPGCWVRIEPDEAGVTAKPGAGLIRSRKTYLEYWPLAAIADRLAADPELRAWLAPVLSPQLRLQDRDVIDPVRPPSRLTGAQWAVVSRCDGRAPARRIAEETVAEQHAGLRTPDDVYFMLGDLVRRGFLRWDFDLPVCYAAEQVLSDRIARIPDGAIRRRAQASLGELSALKNKVAASAGDADAVAWALAELDSAFERLSGLAGTRRPGAMYVGRTLCVEETTRDLDVTIGSAVLGVIAPPLAVVLTIARWLCAAVTRAYRREFERIHADLAAEFGTGEVPLGPLWFLAQDAFYGAGPRPVDAVADELSRRWSSLFGLDPADLERADVKPADPHRGTKGRLAVPRLTFSSGALATRIDELFPPGPSWSTARIHSPDLQFAARSADDFARGAFYAVLGELHAAWPANGVGALVFGHEDPERLRQALRRDLGGKAIYPLLPLDWPRYTPRLAFVLDDPRDPQLGFAAAPGADRRRLLPISGMTVRHGADGLVAVAADGRCWQLTEVFGRLLSEITVEAFKLTCDGPHTPRLTIDRLVVGRETWRTTVGECPVVTARSESECYLAVRRWKASLRLPDHVFVKVATEPKPMFFDLTSPAYSADLAGCLRAARQDGSDAASVVVTEMLPGPQDAWVPDAEGRRYVAELRLHVRDERAVTGDVAEGRPGP